MIPEPEELERPESRSANCIHLNPQQIYDLQAAGWLSVETARRLLLGESIPVPRFTELVGEMPNRNYDAFQSQLFARMGLPRSIYYNNENPSQRLSTGASPASARELRHVLHEHLRMAARALNWIMPTTPPQGPLPDEYLEFQG